MANQSENVNDDKVLFQRWYQIHVQHVLGKIYKLISNFSRYEKIDINYILIRNKIFEWMAITKSVKTWNSCIV